MPQCTPPPRWLWVETKTAKFAIHKARVYYIVCIETMQCAVRSIKSVCRNAEDICQKSPEVNYPSLWDAETRSEDITPETLSRKVCLECHVIIVKRKCHIMFLSPAFTITEGECSKNTVNSLRKSILNDLRFLPRGRFCGGLNPLAVVFYSYTKRRVYFHVKSEHGVRYVLFNYPTIG